MWESQTFIDVYVHDGVKKDTFTILNYAPAGSLIFKTMGENQRKIVYEISNEEVEQPESLVNGAERHDMAMRGAALVYHWSVEVFQRLVGSARLSDALWFVWASRCTMNPVSVSTRNPTDCPGGTRPWAMACGAAAARCASHHGGPPQHHRSARFCVFSSRLYPMVRLPSLDASQQ